MEKKIAAPNHTFVVKIDDYYAYYKIHQSELILKLKIDFVLKKKNNFTNTIN